MSLEGCSFRHKVLYDFHVLELDRGPSAVQSPCAAALDTAAVATTAVVHRPSFLWVCALTYSAQFIKSHFTAYSSAI